MPGNHVLLETIALTQSATSITFDSIPQTGYSDLKIVMSARSSVSQPYDGTTLTFNGTSSSSNWTRRQIEGGDGAVNAYNNTTSIGGYISGGNATANTFGISEIYISNYTSSTNKSISIDSVSASNATNGVYQDLISQLWSNTSAITSITLSTTNFVAGSTFSLYGIAATGTTPTVAPKATGGNIVANDGTYWYHAFTSSGNFVAQTALSNVDYLVVAGGGAGGSAYEGAGGGAGGLRSTVGATGGGGSLETRLSLLAQSYAVTIGAGGAAVNPERNGNPGSNSTFATITSIGGGYGACGGNNQAGGNGGSGGGTARSLGAGSGTTGQGYAGGNGSGDVGGGGGGAGAQGSGAGAGGAGVSISALASVTLTGVSNFYAGGGGGGNSGSGGSGGGGAGHPTAASSGVVNTGSGGGGARTYSPGSSGAGGSGIVIIRYAMV